MAIGVELKKRVKRISEAEKSQLHCPSPRPVEHDRAASARVPSRVAVTRCMKRTGSAWRGGKIEIEGALRSSPGSALTERTSAMPSPATITVVVPGKNLARSMPSHSASVALI